MNSTSKFSSLLAVRALTGDQLGKIKGGTGKSSIEDLKPAPTGPKPKD